MIVSFRDDWLRDFFVEDVRSKEIPSDLESRLFRKIQMIDDATTRRRIRIYGCHPATTSKSCTAILKVSIRSASTKNGGSSFSGMAAEVKRQASIWTTIAICEVNHVDDEAQAGERR